MLEPHGRHNDIPRYPYFILVNSHDIGGKERRIWESGVFGSIPRKNFYFIKNFGFPEVFLGLQRLCVTTDSRFWTPVNR